MRQDEQDFTRLTLRRLAGNKLVQGTATLWTGRISGTAIALVNNVILFRVLGAEGFGRFSVILATATILNQITDIRMWESIVKYLAEYNSRNDQAKATSFIRLSYILTILAGLLAVVIAAVLAYLIYPAFLPDGEGPALLILVVALALQMINLVSQAILRIFDTYWPQAIYQASLSIVSLVFYILLVWQFRMGIRGTALAMLISSLVATLIITLPLVSVLRRQYTVSAPLAALKKQFRDILSFSFHAKLYGMLRMTREVDVILLRFLTNDFVVGIYAVAARVVAVVDIIFEPLFNIIYTEMAKLVHLGQKNRLNRLINIVSIFNPLMVFAGLVLFWLFGEWALVTVLERESLAAYLPILLLLASHIPRQCTTWARPLFLSVNRPLAFNRVTVVAIVVRLGLIVILTPLMLYNGIALAHLIAYSLMALILFGMKGRLVALVTGAEAEKG